MNYDLSAGVMMTFWPVLFNTTSVAPWNGMNLTQNPPTLRDEACAVKSLIFLKGFD